VPVTILTDNVPEANETFNVSIMAAQTFGTTGINATIVNDDFVQVFLQGSISQSEGNVLGSPTFTYSITLNQTSSTPITVTYATMNGSATSADNDYNPFTTTIVIPAGSVSSAYHCYCQR
jgi:hypothetical protein